MATALEIINDAYRENNLIAVGTPPTSAEIAEALPRLRNIVRSLFGKTLGIYLKDWAVPPRRTSPVDARYPMLPASTKLDDDVWPYPPQNVRLIASQDTPTTIYFPPTPNDGAQIAVAPAGADFVTNPLTLDANGRRFVTSGGTYVIDAALTQPITFFYRADLAAWAIIGPLALEDEPPLPEEFDDYFITALNIRLCPRYSKDPRNATVAVYGEQEQKILTRYWQVQPQRPDPHPRNSYATDIGDAYFDEGSLYGR